MSRPALTGTRIRERRLVLGKRQADLARAVGISPSYLNLIEHNRRRIGGKLVQEIARELRVDVSALTEGAEAALLNSLREAAADHREATEELPRIEEFVGRFPGWAQLLADTRRRALGLERTVEALSDRMTHDPFLSASLHEVLSTVTAIRSTATILEETEDIDPEWQARFHRNMAEESRRLAEGAEALVKYLDEATDTELAATTPLEEVDVWLRGLQFHIADLERALPPEPEAIIGRAEALQSRDAQELALSYLQRYRRDAEHMPLAEFAPEAREMGFDPSRLAQRFGVDLAAVFRRLAAMPKDALGASIGLVTCDGSGTLTLRKPVAGFAMPRYSAACPLWPLYQALMRPMAPVRQAVEMGGRAPRTYLTYAICQPVQPAGFDGPQVMEALMLIVPMDLMEGLAPEHAALSHIGAPHPIGTSCRICPRTDCAARREPSIMGQAG